MRSGETVILNGWMGRSDVGAGVENGEREDM